MPIQANTIDDPKYKKQTRTISSLQSRRISNQKHYLFVSETTIFWRASQNTHQTVNDRIRYGHYHDININDKYKKNVSIWMTNSNYNLTSYGHNDVDEIRFLVECQLYHVKIVWCTWSYLFFSFSFLYVSILKKFIRVHILFCYIGCSSRGDHNTRHFHVNYHCTWLAGHVSIQCLTNERIQWFLFHLISHCRELRVRIPSTMTQIALNHHSIQVHSPASHSCGSHLEFQNGPLRKCHWHFSRWPYLYSPYVWKKMYPRASNLFSDLIH